MANRVLDHAASFGVKESNRRTFLGGLGALSLAAVSNAGSAGAQPDSQALQMNGLSEVKVTREETFQVPGGTEHFYEWTGKSPAGVQKRFAVHTTRVDTAVSYTVSTVITVDAFQPGADLSRDPASRKHQTLTHHGIKGDTVGAVRHDLITTTTIHADGTTTREQRMVNVQLTSPTTGQDFQAVAAKAGRKAITGER